MHDYSLSMKINGEYETMINIKMGKYGPQLALMPTFKPVLMAWLKNPTAEYLNMNIKDWGEKKPQEEKSYATASKGTYVKPTQAQVDELDDEIPF